MNRIQDKQNQQNTLPIAIKISTFNPELQLPLMTHRYSANQKIQLRRQMVHTPTSIRRHPQPEQQAYADTKIQTAHCSRLSHFVKAEICKLRENKFPFHQYQPLMKQKIKQLRSIMYLKSLAIRNSVLNNHTNFGFTEYKIHKTHQNRGQSVLHSRTKYQSPFTTNNKSKKYLSLNVQKQKTPQKSEKHLIVQKSPKQYLEEPQTKLVMIGGSLTTIATVPNYSQKRNKYIQSRQSRPYSHVREYLYRKSLLRKAQKRIEDSFADRGTDCKPWQTDDYHAYV